MSETNSSPVDWVLRYQHGGGGSGGAAIVFGQPASVSDSTLVTTTGPNVPPTMEGRVARSARRRSRASRRAPTTLLNTDTTNFRAMVQQFTGIPSAPYTTGYQPAGAPVINFSGQHLRQTPTVMPFGYLHHLQQLQPSQQQQETLFTLGNNNNNHPSDALLHGFNSDGLFSDGVHGHGHVVPRNAPTDSRTDGYFL